MRFGNFKYTQVIMNTPSHAILNLLVLSGFAPNATLPILIGAVIPDVPMFVLVVWARVQRIPASEVWSTVYWQPFWQDFTHGFHSIPIALIIAIMAHLLRVDWLKWLCISAILHSLGDLPVHHDDAHRHFLPLSQYRFISPISYWDRQYYGQTVACIEILLVVAASIYLFPRTGFWLGKAALVSVNVAYLGGLTLLLLF
jgi:hypothetical protein